MFNKSIRKIVALVMGFLVVFIILTIGAIYLSTYYKVKKENSAILDRYVISYTLDGNQGPNGNPEEFPPEGDSGEIPAMDSNGNQAGEGKDNIRPDGFQPRDGMRPVDRLSTFYSVAFDSDGNVLKIENASIIYSENELIQKAQTILKKNKAKGTTGTLSYLVKKTDDYTLVAFIDNTIANNNFNTLLTITIIGGAISVVVAFFVSILLAKKIVKPLEENDKRQKQFISDAGHELKTPVAIINANSELLEREVGTNEWLTNIQYENERMRLLVTELLDLSRTENAKVPMERLDLSHLVTGEVLPFETLAFEAGKTINSTIDNDIYVNGNNNELKQLVSILLDNAIRHSLDNSEINLVLKHDHKNVTLSIDNSANEISKEELDRLFERFYRVDDARNSEGHHYGLGLPIAKAIVNNHKGTIDVHYDNGKITFTVTLSIVK